MTKALFKYLGPIGSVHSHIWVCLLRLNSNKTNGHEIKAKQVNLQSTFDCVEVCILLQGSVHKPRGLLISYYVANRSLHNYKLQLSCEHFWKRSLCFHRTIYWLKTYCCCFFKKKYPNLMQRLFWTSTFSWISRSWGKPMQISALEKLENIWCRYVRGKSEFFSFCDTILIACPVQWKIKTFEFYTIVYNKYFDSNMKCVSENTNI